jgi:hypothetical protein
MAAERRRTQDRRGTKSVVLTGEARAEAEAREKALEREAALAILGKARLGVSSHVSRGKRRAVRRGKAGSL